MTSRFALALVFVLALLSWRPLLAADGPPAPNQPGPRLVRVSGNDQTVQPGVSFALAVRLEGVIPLGGVDVGVLRVLSGGPVIECVGEETDAAGFAVVVCTAGFWPLRTQVFITVSDEAGRIAPDFGVTITPPVFTEGIASIGPTRLTVPRNEDFELAVRAISNGVPDEGLVLTVQRTPAEAPISCPNTVSTDVDGLARIICSSLDVGVDVTVLITLSDVGGRSETFTVLALAQDALQDGVFKASGDDQAIPEGTVLPQPLVALVVREGRPAGGSRVTVEVSDTDVLVCAETVVADVNGFAAITCASSIIVDQGLATNAFAAIEVESDGLRLADPFRVSVVRGLFTIANSIRVKSLDPIRAEAGETVEDAIRVEAFNELDLPQAGAPIYFSSDQNITFDPPVAITDAGGETYTSLTFGCPGGSGRVNVGVRPGLTVARVDVEIGTGEPNVLSKLQGDGQSGVPGERLSDKALVVLVSDRCFNPGRGQPVSWRVEPPDAATLENVVERTDGRGRASVLVRLGDRPGPFEVIASFGRREQTFKLETLAIPGGLTAISGQRQSIPRGELSEPLEVRLLTESGLAVPGRDVLFTVLSGDGFVTQSVVATDAMGRAATQFRAGDSFGLATVAATLPTAALSPEGAAQGAFEALFEIVVGGRVPQVAAEGFVDGASFRVGWAPGGLASIFGTGLMEDIVGIESARNAPFPDAASRRQRLGRRHSRTDHHLG